MKYLAALSLALGFVQAATVKRSDVNGIDVSDYQSSINWASVVNNGVQFVYIKATEGTSYISPSFGSQYIGATNAGLIRGAYHFARPDIASGSAQATYFVQNGGGWTSDGITLPGAVDLERNPSGDYCYDLTPDGMVSWIQDFSDTYQSSTGRYPVFYTTTSWWSSCTGNNGGFGNNNPLWIADWSSTLGPLPAGWGYASFWQYADSGPNPGDADYWSGDYSGLQSMAYGHPV